MPATTNAPLVDYQGKYYHVLGHYPLYFADLFKEMRLKSRGGTEENGIEVMKSVLHIMNIENQISLASGYINLFFIISLCL